MRKKWKTTVVILGSVMTVIVAISMLYAEDISQ